MALQSKTLLVATKNPGKAREFALLLGNSWKVETLLALPALTEGVEDGATFEENAAKKALAIAAQVGPEVFVLADDSGLEVDALGGAPGVYSARYAGENDPHFRDEANNGKLLAAMKEVPDDNRGAQFRCALCLVKGNEVVATADGVCRGILLDAPYGHEGFGYDPLFVPDGAEQKRTFAEMPLDQKHRFSHRAMAMGKMAAEMGRMV